MLPVVIVGSLLAGATTVQSAALYTLIVQRFVQCDLAGFSDLRRAISHSIALVGGIASYRFSKPVLHLARAMLPMYVILLIGVLLTTYVPWLTTGLLR